MLRNYITANAPKKYQPEKFPYQLCVLMFIVLYESFFSNLNAVYLSIEMLFGKKNKTKCKSQQQQKQKL